MINPKFKNGEVVIIGEPSMEYLKSKANIFYPEMFQLIGKEQKIIETKTLTVGDGEQVTTIISYTLESGYSFPESYLTDKK